MYKNPREEGKGSMMVVRRICAVIVGAMLVFGTVSAAEAAVLIYVDMDTVAQGVQDTRLAAAGESFPVDLLMDVTDDAVTGYGVSAQFDNIELNATAAEELLPPEFQFNITPGVGGIDPDIGGGWGQVTTFEAGGFGFGAVAPISGILLGTIDFDVKTAIDDGIADVIPGFFNTGVDGAIDSASASRDDVQFAPGFVIPEPASMLLLGLGGLAVMRRRR